MMDPKIRPCLWFDGNAEEAARFYADTFPDSRIDKLSRTRRDDYPAGKKGDALVGRDDDSRIAVHAFERRARLHASTRR